MHSITICQGDKTLTLSKNTVKVVADIYGLTRAAIYDRIHRRTHPETIKLLFDTEMETIRQRKAKMKEMDLTSLN